MAEVATPSIEFSSKDPTAMPVGVTRENISAQASLAVQCARVDTVASTKKRVAKCMAKAC